MMDDGEDVRFDWRRGGAAAAGLVAALVLVAMVFLVKFANDAREQALTAERQAYRRRPGRPQRQRQHRRAPKPRSRRFVLDENVDPSGNIYASDWQLAGYQIGQLKRLDAQQPGAAAPRRRAEALYNKRGERTCSSPPAQRWRSRAIRASAISMPRRAMSRTPEYRPAARRQARGDHPRRAAGAAPRASSKASSSPPRPTS